MNKLLKILLPACTAYFIASSAVAEDIDFVGAWVNVNPNTTGIVRLEISPTLKMKMWGACTPVLCNNGTSLLTTYGINASETNHKVASAYYAFSFKQVETILKITGPGQLVLENYNKFTDGSARQNYWQEETFQKVTPVENEQSETNLRDFLY